METENENVNMVYQYHITHIMGKSTALKNDKTHRAS